ncbi:MAG: hypothetical protein GY765_37100 [bacterium]|nr:hypothetical protein [bacterium]
MIRFEEQKGKFAKHCPCTPGVVPCGYFNLNLHTGCPYDCSYCILQTYLETTEPVFFTNIDVLEKELEELSRRHEYLRIGTGELSDSLAFDGETQYSHKILSIFEKFPRIIFEFKTKSATVDNILNYGKTLGNIVIAWSLNPQEVIGREETGTPGLKTRLAALQKVQEQGLKVALHFDPLLIFPGWREAYRELVREIAAVVRPEAIAWWSLGALRFPYSLREHIFKHFQSRLFDGELVKGSDGKYRYFKPLRMELFRFVKAEIQARLGPGLPLYLCMEDEDVWREILPGFPSDEASVNEYLYRSAFKPFQD